MATELVGRSALRPYDESVPGRETTPMRLRLYHHSDGARVAYREVGAGPPLALVHAGLLSHREWEPVVERLPSATGL